ncbi:MAG: class I SAM-dependent methyltransferase [Gammaproteobacteria bacterium]
MNQCGKPTFCDLHHEVLNASLSSGRIIRVPEAGRGSFTHIRIPHSKYVTLLDISPEQLERNTYADEKILGDLEDEHALTLQKYDLIVCFNVLEHLRYPERAFSNLAQSLAYAGLLVIGCPNLLSVKGLTTRFMPHGFHVWYYRSMRGVPESGQSGYAFVLIVRRPAARSQETMQSAST